MEKVNYFYRIAFPGGTQGKLRHSILQTIKDKIATLRIKQHSTFLRHGETSNEWPEIPACVIFEKPIERILIRYDRFVLPSLRVKKKSLL
jgi:hypothetical protein